MSADHLVLINEMLKELRHILREKLWIRIVKSHYVQDAILIQDRNGDQLLLTFRESDLVIRNNVVKEDYRTSEVFWLDYANPKFSSEFIADKCVKLLKGEHLNENALS